MSLCHWPSPSSSSSASFRRPPMENQTNPFLSMHFVPIPSNPTLQITIYALKPKSRRPTISCCSNNNNYSIVAENGTTSYELPPVVKKKRGAIISRQYPGQKEGITEEMRFVAMKLRKVKKVEAHSSDEEGEGEEEDGGGDSGSVEEDGGSGRVGQTWKPTMEGFLKYLVDSKHVFDFIERIVDESDDVSYAYFRKTGLERSKGLSEDLEWFSQQGIVIPPPSKPGIAYVKYLEGLAEKNPRLFLAHFYNIYFAHIAGGQVIAKQVSENLLQGRELEFYKWKGNAEELFKDVREKLNMLGENWRRDVKNRCLSETMRSLRYMGKIVRLIVL